MDDSTSHISATAPFAQASRRLNSSVTCRSLKQQRGTIPVEIAPIYNLWNKTIGNYEDSALDGGRLDPCGSCKPSRVSDTCIFWIPAPKMEFEITCHCGDLHIKALRFR
jgi:hypothetical protein